MATVVNASSWLWYFSRATGLVALVLLSAIVVLGVLGPLRVTSERWPRFAIRTVHRDVSLLAVLVVVIHVLVIVLDTYVKVPITAAVLPWGSSYEPLWTGMGAIALDLLLAIVVTSLLRRRIGYRTWRSVHWLAYVSWPVAVAHGLGAGTDSSSPMVIVLTLTCIAAVAVAITVRVQQATAARPANDQPADAR